MDQSPLYENEGTTEQKEDETVAMTTNDDEELDNSMRDVIESTKKNVQTSLDHSNAEQEPINDDVMSHDKPIEDTEEEPTTPGEMVSDAPPPQSPTTSENPFLIDEQVIQTMITGGLSQKIIYYNRGLPLILM